ncbi:MAG: DUF4158 domain-containing protein [Chloroflexi bacterium]|nr:MAG: DUF4158 domain-containing protein [Chloroflexota bacterium]
MCPFRQSNDLSRNTLRGISNTLAERSPTQLPLVFPLLYISRSQDKCIDLLASHVERDNTVPVEFLTAEQRSRYGCYAGEPSPEQLARYFHLDDRDRALLDPRRHAHTRLGFALQLCTVRFLGTFLSDPTDVPHNVVLQLSSQLNIADLTVLSRYREGEMRYDHVHEIMAEYGYQDFSSQPEHFRFLRWLYTRTWWSEERLTILFDLAMARLIDRKVLLPGVSVLERLISSAREHASQRLWRLLSAIPTPPQRALLETFLEVPPGERQTPLDCLRRGPTRVSVGVVMACG